MPKRSERREYVRDQIKGYLAGKPLTSTELIQKVHLPEGGDAQLVHSCLHDLKAKGELAYSLSDKLYSLADGPPAPPAAARPAAGAITTPPVPRETGPRAPSRFKAPPKQKPAAKPSPAPRADPPAAAANGAAKPEHPDPASEQDRHDRDVDAQPLPPAPIDLDVPRFLDGHDVDPAAERRRIRQVRARLLIQASDLRIQAAELLSEG